MTFEKQFLIAYGSFNILTEIFLLIKLLNKSTLFVSLQCCFTLGSVVKCLGLFYICRQQKQKHFQDYQSDH